MNILSSYYFDPVLSTVLLVMPTTLDDLPPEDPLQYFERMYGQGIQLEFGFIEFDSIQEFLTPNINKSDFLPPIINEILDLEVLPKAYASPNVQSVCDSNVGEAFRIVCHTFDTDNISGSKSTNLGTLGTIGDALYTVEKNPSNFVINSTGKIAQSAIKNGTSDGNTNGEIRIGSTPSTWNFLNNVVGDNITSINFWINGDFVGAPVYPMMNTGDSDANSEEGFSIWTQSGTNMHLTIRDAPLHFVESADLGDVPADDGAWHMITLIMDKGNTTGNWVVYCLDGTCSNTGAGSQNFPFLATVDPPFENLTMGGDADFGNAVTQNTINFDDLAIWQGYQLTQSDVDGLFALSSTPSSVSNQLTSDVTIVIDSVTIQINKTVTDIVSIIEANDTSTTTAIVSTLGDAVQDVDFLADTGSSSGFIGQLFNPTDVEQLSIGSTYVNGKRHSIISFRSDYWNNNEKYY